MKGFTEEQKSELELPKKHTKGESIEDFLTYLSVSGKDNNRLLLYAYSSIQRIKGDDKNPLISSPIYTSISYLSRNPETSKNKLLFEVLRRSFLPKPNTGRVKASECILNNDDLSCALITEGIPEAEEIYHKAKLASMETNSLNNTGTGRNILGNSFDRGWKAHSFLLGLDDMNIRGQQLVYALEYFDGDIPSMVVGVTNRDTQMVEYINYRIHDTNYHIEGALSIMPKAVSGGASSTEGYDFAPPIDCMISPSDNIKKVGKKTVDYSSRSILFPTTLEEGLKILDALGFKLVWKSNLISINDFKKDLFGKDNYFIILVNPNNGSICKISSATDDCILNGGMDILVPFKDTGDSFFSYFGEVETNRIEGREGYCVGRIHSSGGSDDIIDIYKRFTRDVECVKDSDILGYGSWNQIPILKKYDFEHDSYNHRECKDKLLEMLISQNSLYGLSDICNCLEMDRSVASIPKEFRSLYSSFLKNKYRLTMEYVHFSIHVESSTLYFGTAFNMLNIPDSEIEKYYEAAKSSLKGYMTEDAGLKYLNSKKGKETFFGKSKKVLSLINEFNISCKKDLSSLTNKVKHQDLLCKKFTKILKPICKALNNCAYMGEWVLKEENGNTYLSGPGGKVEVLKDGTVNVDGYTSRYSEKQWKIIIENTIGLVIKEVHKPIKEISFDAHCSFTSVTIQSHPQEPSSYKVILS